jgi:hypothetical protein
MITENIKIVQEYEIEYSNDEGRKSAIDKAKKGAIDSTVCLTSGSIARIRKIGGPMEMKNESVN